jgi:hypothetical protein
MTSGLKEFAAHVDLIGQSLKQRQQSYKDRRDYQDAAIKHLVLILLLGLKKWLAGVRQAITLDSTHIDLADGGGSLWCDASWYQII